MAQGTVTLDFGVFPGATDATVAVTGQTAILAGSLVEAWILPAATTDHSVDEHWVESLRVYAGNIVAGTGFTVYGRADNGGGGNRGFDTPRIYGKWNIAWVWN